MKKELLEQEVVQWFICFPIIKQEVNHHRYPHITALIVGMCWDYMLKIPKILKNDIKLTGARVAQEVDSTERHIVLKLPGKH